jgi:hypothetical protein
MSRHIIIAAFLLAAAISCGSDSNGPSNTTLQGVINDYDAGGAVAGATVSLLERPTSTTTTDAGGNFELTDLTRGNSVRVVVTATNYAETVNPIRLLGAATINVTDFAVSAQFVTNQYTAAGVIRSAGAGTLIVELEDDLGTPRTGIPQADITLLDQNQAPAGTGPYIFGAGGSLDNTLVVTTAFGGRSRIAFLDIAPGNYTLKVIEGIIVLTRPLQVRTDGVTLVVR